MKRCACGASLGAISYSIDGGADCCVECGREELERAQSRGQGVVAVETATLRHVPIERPWDEPFRIAVSEPEPKPEPPKPVEPEPVMRDAYVNHTEYAFDCAYVTLGLVPLERYLKAVEIRVPLKLLAEHWPNQLVLFTNRVDVYVTEAGESYVKPAAKAYGGVADVFSAVGDSDSYVEYSEQARIPARRAPELDGLSRAFQALTEVRSEAEDIARASTDEQLFDYAERHPVPEHRETARAEMQARWAARAALPPMLDDFDNLPDAEPAGIVRRP